MRAIIQFFLLGFIVLYFYGCGGTKSSVKVEKRGMFYYKDAKTVQGEIPLAVDTALLLENVQQKLYLTSFDFSLGGSGGNGCVIQEAFVNGHKNYEKIDITKSTKLDFTLHFQSPCYNLEYIAFRGEYSVETYYPDVATPQVEKKELHALISNAADIAAQKSRYSISGDALDHNNTMYVGESKVFYVRVIDERGEEIDPHIIDRITILPVDSQKVVVLSQTDTNRSYITYTLKAKEAGQTEVKVVVGLKNFVAIEFIQKVTILPKKRRTLAKIVVEPSVIHVEAGKSYPIKIWTLDDQNNFVTAALHANMLLDRDNRLYGELSSYDFLTDESGEAVITYQAPDDITPFAGTIQTIVLTNRNTGVTQTVKLIFPEKKRVAAIVVTTPHIQIKEGAQAVIDIYTLDNSGSYYPHAKVKIGALIDPSTNRKLGTFLDMHGGVVASEFETDDYGHFRLIYQAPSYVERNLSFDVRLQSDIVETTLYFTIKKSSANDIYSLELQMPGGIRVDGIEHATLTVTRGDKDSPLPVAKIEKIELSSQNGYLLFENRKNTITYTTILQNPFRFTMRSSSTSGIDILNVHVTIIDEEGNARVLEKQLPVTILSGPVHTISLVYKSGKFNTDTGLFEDIYTVHASDKYGNPAREGSRIYVGAIAGVKLFAPQDGTITYEHNQTLFHTSHDLSNIEPHKDTLIILPSQNHLDSLYLGGWEIEKVIQTTSLALLRRYDGETTNGLDYVIGNEKRLDSCSYNTVTLSFDHADGTYLIGKGGITFLKLIYDPYLVGKTVFLYANAYDSFRVGATKRVILMGEGIESEPQTCNNSQGSGALDCRLYIHLAMKGPKFSVRNMPIGGVELVNKENLAKCSIQPRSFKTDCTGVVAVDVRAAAQTVCTVDWNKVIVSEY